MNTKKPNPHPGITHERPSSRFPKGPWIVRYRDLSNATLRRSFHAKKDAMDFQASVRTDKNRGDFINPRHAATPFGSVAEDWYISLQVRPKTMAGYRSILDAHLLEFYPRAIGRINATEVERFLTGRGVSPSYQRNIVRVMSSVFAFAIRGGLVRANPASQVKLPKVVRKEELYLTANQVQELADEITPIYRTLVLTAAYTGMRAGELSALRVKNIDLMRGRIKVVESLSDVRGQLSFHPPKNGRVRAVGIPPFLVDLLMEQSAGKPPSDLVFTGPLGAPLRHGNYYQRHYKVAVSRLVERGDWPEHLDALRFHDLRHTNASLLIAQGHHPKAIAERLGHGSIAITMDRYGHLYDDHDDAMLTGMEEIFRAAAPLSAADATVSTVGIPSSSLAVPLGRHVG